MKFFKKINYDRIFRGIVIYLFVFLLGIFGGGFYFQAKIVKECTLFKGFTFGPMLFVCKRIPNVLEREQNSSLVPPKTLNL